ncbi:flagellar basal body L-ring protein FlgH [Curvibacter gracilis]|uniref:flagellar basal body L-ring protein FlgH n=1 Tax=Curvibacter gracilis TaxID=230310 RepID=UPI0004B0215D|nr:flagellar basal body L-ring protein FlgH [Curvibacter gracilis]
MNTPLCAPACRPALRLTLLACVAALCTACETLAPVPKVDVLPTTPPDLAPMTHAAPASAGSLFRTSAYRPAFEDRRARLVGDVVTVQIVESVTATTKVSTDTARKSNTSSGISAFPFLSSSTASKLNLGATTDSSFSGKGDVEAANTFTGTITTTVIDVLPNGHLVVSGEKQIGLNQTVDVMKFSGTVDPRSLQPGSIVASTQVANVRIHSRGRGGADEAQTIGWLSRFFSTLSPF